MRASVGLLLIVSIVALSGCPTDGSGGNVGISGDLNATEDGFYLDGRVGHTGLVEPTYHNVTLYLYTANGSVIAAEHLGTVSESNSLSVEIRTNRIPKYVIINSPEFWEGSTADVNYYKYVEHVISPDGTYSEQMIGSKDEFPVAVPPNETAKSASLTT